MPPIGLSFWRWVLAGLLILPFTWRRLLEHIDLILVNIKLLLKLTFALVVLGNTTIYIALHYTTAINAGVVSMTQPAVTILLTWLFFRETVTRSQILGAVIAAFGDLVIILRGDMQALANVTINIGDFWMLASV